MMSSVSMPAEIEPRTRERQLVARTGSQTLAQEREELLDVLANRGLDLREPREREDRSGGRPVDRTESERLERALACAAFPASIDEPEHERGRDLHALDPFERVDLRRR